MIRRHRRPQQDSDLDITAFMNLMIVLVPILLMGLIFAQTSVIELNFPKADQAQQLSPQEVDLRVMILPSRIDVLEGEKKVIKRIEMVEGEYNFEQLSEVMQALKKRIPQKRDLTIFALPVTSYQTIVSVMDAVRSFKTVVAGSAVRAELFPDVGIADVPDEVLEEGGV